MEKTTISVEDFARRNCAAIVQRQESQSTTGSRRTSLEGPRLTFECKTCGRTFESFQALGGHRANHQKAALTGNSGGGSPVHECRVCGLRFPTGTALGGHVRKHGQKGVKRKRGDEDGGETKKKRKVETGADDRSETATRGVSPFDLNLPPADQETRDFLAGLER